MNILVSLFFYLFIFFWDITYKEEDLKVNFALLVLRKIVILTLEASIRRAHIEPGRQKKKI